MNEGKQAIVKDLKKEIESIQEQIRQLEETLEKGELHKGDKRAK